MKAGKIIDAAKSYMSGIESVDYEMPKKKFQPNRSVQKLAPMPKVPGPVG